MSEVIKVNYPKDMNYNPADFNENLYQEELSKLTNDAFADANTTRTLKNIKEALSKHIRKEYGISDKTKLTETTQAFLSLHGLSDDRFDPMGQFAKFMTSKVNEVSIDDNSNKDHCSIKGTLKEIELPFDKLIGYDYLYRTMKELYGIDEAKRLSALMYDFSLAIGDSTNILIPYCWAFDATKIVMTGRPFGQLPSKPAKRVGSYVAALCETIHQLASHLAGAVAIGTFFMDIAHILIYKQRISYDKICNNAAFRKQLENEMQQFIHSVNHLSRNGIESPFTNVSIFDKEKLFTFISEDNYQWYFPKHIKVLADNELGDENGKISREEFDKFVVDYIFEVQKIFIDLFDKGDPSQNGLQYRFPVCTINLTKHLNDQGKMVLDENNELLDYISKKDIARYNIFISEGTKIASCCRMVNDQEMMDQLGSTVNSFGGSGGASLGSHRVVTINFARLAYQATSYDDYKDRLQQRVNDAAKILKAHKVLLLKLTEMGAEPFMKLGWIDAYRFFSTFGVLGIYEARKILVQRFNNKSFDYTEDILKEFTKYTIEAGKQEGLVINREEIPAESMAGKLFKADNLLFGNPYNFIPLYANQFVPTWEKVTIAEKMQIEGKYDRYLSGGSIAHLQIGSSLTPTQSKNIIKKSVECGLEHFALNCWYSKCNDCGEVEKAKWEVCPHCGSKNTINMTRVIGFFIVVQNANTTRQKYDFPNRHFFDAKELD